MYERILIPVDLGDPNLAKPALDTAVMMAEAGGGTIRIINVLPVTPAMLTEYVPADFEEQQRRSAEEALSIIVQEVGLDGRVSSVVRQGGTYQEILEEAKVQGRPHRHELAPGRRPHLLPRLGRGPCGALRQLLGPGGARLIYRFAAAAARWPAGRPAGRERCGGSNFRAARRTPQSGRPVENFAAAPAAASRRCNSVTKAE